MLQFEDSGIGGVSHWQQNRPNCATKAIRCAGKTTCSITAAWLTDLDVATRVSVQLQLTDPDLKSRDRVVKKTEKDGLYNAMDVAAVWLDRALANN